MRVRDIPTPAIVHHFAKGRDGSTHYRANPYGPGVMLVRVEACDACGAECLGANPVIFDNATIERDSITFRRAGLKPTNVAEELGANDDGEAVCPDCYDRFER